MSAMPPPKYSRVECIDVLSRCEPFRPTIREVHAFVHHLTPRAPFADVKVQVGDLVRVCQPAFGVGPARLTRHAYRVQEVCPWRGVRCEGLYWHRSWVRVQGGAS